MNTLHTCTFMTNFFSSFLFHCRALIRSIYANETAIKMQRKTPNSKHIPNGKEKVLFGLYMSFVANTLHIYLSTIYCLVYNKYFFYCCTHFFLFFRSFHSFFLILSPKLFATFLFVYIFFLPQLVAVPHTLAIQSKMA